MPSRIKHGLLISITAISLFFLSIPSSYSQSVNYVYDELNRLIRVEYGNEVVIEYEYDKAGNRLEKMSGMGADTTPPVGTVLINGGANYTNTVGVTLTLTCSDVGWGCVEMKFSDGGPYSSEEAIAGSRPWTLSPGDGLKTVWAMFRDGARNWSSGPQANDSIILDTIAPTTGASPAGGTYNAAQSVTLTCDDGTGSGCDKIYYTTDGTTPTTSSPVYSAPINIPINTTLKYFARDLAGNNESVKTQNYIIDTIAPLTTASPPGGIYNTARSVTLTCNDGTGSGCQRTCYTTDGTDPTSCIHQYSSPILISSTTTLKFFSRDFAGNNEIVKTENYIIDTIAPVTTASPPGGYWNYNTALQVSLSCSDSGGSGCQITCYTTDGTDPTSCIHQYTAPIPISLTTTLKFFSRDLAGDSEVVRTEVYNIGPVRIGTTNYNTIQAAYSVAVTGNIIKCRDLPFVESLTVDRNITVTLEGGYNSDFTSNYGIMTTLRGMITTTAGGGTITIENFILSQ
jgi:YD repeat-containing protein